MCIDLVFIHPSRVLPPVLIYIKTETSFALHHHYVSVIDIPLDKLEVTGAPRVTDK